MDKYKLLIFDFDGTLAATEPAIQFCMKTAFEDYGLIPPPEKAVRAAIGIPLMRMIANLGGLDDAAAREVTDIYRKYYRKEGMEMTRLFPSAFETVERLHCTGYKIAVVSNKNHAVVVQSVEITGLMPFCGLVAGERDGQFQKPHPQAFTEIIVPCFGVAASECLMIGDAVQDTGFALNCGMDAAWASYGFGNETECMNENVKFVLNDISELTDILG
ncbi:HAD family hydrolase [Geovibrio thiophilus]|uniref:phosphoglycolate phosphatase n=1 Tax=Geovibrio thiophilus TaxID=139438 RepID=A0A410JW48_9BACT|nr:HAD family hydrolase [Geovibrio thiophilus]QAR32279.1 HAD family hydrolase [Geovibrio thiophilus]